MGNEEEQKSNNNNNSLKNLDDSKITIRQMRFDEIEQSLKIFSRAGLNDAVNTLQTYYETDPQGFVVAFDEYEDKVIGSCAAPMTTHQTSFVGLYVMEPAYQGLGIGVKLFNRCLDKVGSGNCGLSAVPSKFKIYKDKAGFRIMEGRSLVIIEGKPNGIGALKSVSHLEPRYRIAKLTSVDYDEQLVQKIIDFDQTVHLDNRSKLLRIFFSKPNTITMAVIDSFRDDKVVGYGSIQLDIIDRAMIGPLYAMDGNIGEILLAELIRSDSIFAQNNQLVYFTMDNSHESLRLATDVLGLNEVCRCEKLYTKFIPPFNYDYLFCCHTPDFSC